MNMKRILVLVMTFAMLLGAFAPTLGVFAGNHKGTTTNEKLNYVSIGDSMANGFGFTGYEQGKEGHNFFEGIGTYGDGAYPLQFEQYLKDQGYDVEHTKLAVSALTPETLLHFLGGRDWIDSPWHEGVLDYAGEYDLNKVCQHYQNAVKTADIITLGIGNGNFGTFLLSEATDIIGIMGAAPSVDERYTLENALSFVESEEVKEIVLEVYETVKEYMFTYLPAGVADFINIEAIADLVAYTTAGYLVNYAMIIDKIVEINESEDLEVILVGLMNTTYGMTIDLGNGSEFAFGDMMDSVFEIMNAYMTAYPTARYLGNDNAPKFYYAAQPNPDFIVNAFDDLAESGWTSTDNGRLSGDIIRDRAIETYNDTLRIMIANAMFAEDVANYGVDNVLPKVELEHVKAWKSWEELREENYIPEGSEYDAPVNAYGLMHGNSALTTSVALYLGLEDAIVESVNKVEKYSLSGLQTIADQEKLMGIMSGLGDVSASPYAIREGLANHLSQDDILPLVKIFAIFKVGNGLCVHPTPSGHDNITKEIVKAYEEEWTAQEQTIQNIMNAYENAYQFADEQGAFDTASSAIETAIDAIYVAIEEVKCFDGISDELKDRLVKELYATIDTLEELKLALDLDKAETLDGLAGVIVDLKDDLFTHLENIYAILEQAGIEYGPVVLEYIETVVIPAVVEAVETFVNDVIAYVQEKVEYYFGVAYDYLVEVLVRVQLYIQEKLDNAIRPIINAYYKLYDKLVEIYGTIEEAIKFANLVFEKIVEFNDILNGALAYATEQIVDLFITLYEVYGSVEKALLALNDILMNIVETAGQVIEDAIAIYNTVLEILVNTYGAIENAVIVASQIFSLIYDFVGEDLKTMFGDIVAIVTDVYGATKNAYYVASQVYAYLVEVFDYTFDGKYVVDENSAYVALGYPLYCDELAEMLKLADKHYEFGLDEDYIDAIAGADLITVKFDNGEVISFVFGQLSEPTPIDWSNILDAEGQKALEELLASIKVELVVSGKAESLSHVVSDLVGDEEVNLTPEDVAEVLAFAIESAIYCYADFVIRVTTTLENVYTYAPEALVVITGIDNPALLLEFLGVELGEYAQMLDAVVSVINAHFALMTSTNENTVFVDSNDAQDIYDALNVEFDIVVEPDVECEHEYDNCEDTTCNLCGEERVAPGHSFTNYTYNNDATCGVNGTETAKCDNCDAENTREAQGTALQHNWAAATCTACKTCTLCGATEGEMLPHTYGPWNVLREPTHKVQGFQERKCTVCGRLDTAVIPCLDGISTGAIIAIVVGSVVVLGGVGTLVYFQMKKKKVATPANTKTED